MDVFNVYLNCISSYINVFLAGILIFLKPRPFCSDLILTVSFTHLRTQPRVILFNNLSHTLQSGNVGLTEMQIDSQREGQTEGRTDGWLSRPKKVNRIFISHKVGESSIYSLIELILKAYTQSAHPPPCRWDNECGAQRTPSHRQHLFSAQSKCQSRLSVNIRLPLRSVATTWLASCWACPIAARLFWSRGPRPNGQSGAFTGTAPVLPGGCEHLRINKNVGLSLTTLPFYRRKEQTF